MSVSTFAKRTKTVSLGNKEFILKPLTTREIMALVDFFNGTKEELGLKPEEVAFTKEYLTALAQKLWASLRIVKKDGVLTMEGPPKVFFDKLAELLGCQFDDFLDVSPDEIYEAAAGLFEVNSNGPLGLMVRDIIERLTPIAKRLWTALTDSVEINLQRGLIQARPSGGTKDGGSIPLSSPLPESLNGQTEISLTESPLVNSSPTESPLDTLAGMNLPNTESQTPGPEVPRTAEPAEVLKPGKF